MDGVQHSEFAICIMDFGSCYVLEKNLQNRFYKFATAIKIFEELRFVFKQKIKGVKRLQRSLWGKNQEILFPVTSSEPSSKVNLNKGV